MELGTPENQDAKDYILAINTEDFTFSEAREEGVEGTGSEGEGLQGTKKGSIMAQGKEEEVEDTEERTEQTKSEKRM